MPKEVRLILAAGIESRIHLLRGHKVMLDADLAKLYGVETKALNKASNAIVSAFRPTSCFSSPKESLQT